LVCLPAGLLILPSNLFFYSSLLVCLAPLRGVPLGFACLPSLYLLFVL